MGETVIKRSETDKETDIKQGGTNGGTSTTSKSTADTSTERGTTRGDARGTTRGVSGTGTTTEQAETTNRLSVLDDEKERKRLERNAKRRERYQKQKEQQATGQATELKPKKVNNRKAKSNDVDTTQINTLIKTVSTLIASRPNCSHWLLSDAEIESITTPLTKMMQESDLFSKLGEHSNQIALVTACVTVFAPRILTTVILLKEKAKHDRQVRKQVSQGPTIGDNGNDVTENRNAVDDKVNGTNEHWTSSLIY